MAEGDDEVVFRGDDYGAEAGAEVDLSLETPSKQVRRQRPISEQLLGKNRPKAITHDVDGKPY